MAPKPDRQLDSSVVAVENGVPLDHVLPLDEQAAAAPPMKSARKPVEQQQMEDEKRPWYRRPRVLYTIAAVVLLVSVGIAVVAVLLANGTIEMGEASSQTTASNTNSGDSTSNPNDTGDTATDDPMATDAPPPPTAQGGDGNTDGDVVAPEPTATDVMPQPSPPPTALATPETTTTPLRTDPLSFYVMGDVPYAEWEEFMLATQLQEMYTTLPPGAEFVVHVGDMQKAVRTNCGLDRFYQVANILGLGPLPTLVQVGDNDYLDCPDKGAAWESYLQTFVGFEDQWDHSLPIERWTELVNVPMEYNLTRQVAKTEMFAMVQDGILFMGLTLLNMDLGVNEPPDDLFYERLADSKAWAIQQLNKNDASTIRGVVMFSHAMVSPDIRPFFEELREIFFAAGVYAPVLYIHGDGHDFNINTDFGNNIVWPQLTRIEVDQGGYADPLLITVAPSGADGITVEPFTADGSGLQFAVSNGLFLVDRQNGRYPDSVNPNN